MESALFLNAAPNAVPIFRITVIQNIFFFHQELVNYTSAFR